MLGGIRKRFHGGGGRGTECIPQGRSKPWNPIMVRGVMVHEGNFPSITGFAGRRILNNVPPSHLFRCVCGWGREINPACKPLMNPNNCCRSQNAGKRTAFVSSKCKPGTGLQQAYPPRPPLPARTIYIIPKVKEEPSPPPRKRVEPLPQASVKVQPPTPTPTSSASTVRAPTTTTTPPRSATSLSSQPSSASSPKPPSTNSSKPSSSAPSPKPSTSAQSPKPSTSVPSPKPSTSVPSPKPSTSAPSPKPSSSSGPPPTVPTSKTPSSPSPSSKPSIEMKNKEPSEIIEVLTPKFSVVPESIQEQEPEAPFVPYLVEEPESEPELPPEPESPPESMMIVDTEESFDRLPGYEHEDESVPFLESKAEPAPVSYRSSSTKTPPSSSPHLTPVISTSKSSPSPRLSPVLSKTVVPPPSKKSSPSLTSPVPSKSFTSPLTSPEPTPKQSEYSIAPKSSESVIISSQTPSVSSVPSSREILPIAKASEPKISSPKPSRISSAPSVEKVPVSTSSIKEIVPKATVSLPDLGFPIPSEFEFRIRGVFNIYGEEEPEFYGLEEPPGQVEEYYEYEPPPPDEAYEYEPASEEEGDYEPLLPVQDFGQYVTPSLIEKEPPAPQDFEQQVTPSKITRPQSAPSLPVAPVTSSLISVLEKPKSTPKFWKPPKRNPYVSPLKWVQIKAKDKDFCDLAWLEKLPLCDPLRTAYPPQFRFNERRMRTFMDQCIVATGGNLDDPRWRPEQGWGAGLHNKGIGGGKRKSSGGDDDNFGGIECGQLPPWSFHPKGMFYEQFLAQERRKMASLRGPRMKCPPEDRHMIFSTGLDHCALDSWRYKDTCHPFSHRKPPLPKLEPFAGNARDYGVVGGMGGGGAGGGMWRPPTSQGRPGINRGKPPGRQNPNAQWQQWQGDDTYSPWPQQQQSKSGGGGVPPYGQRIASPQGPMGGSQMRGRSAPTRGRGYGRPPATSSTQSRPGMGGYSSGRQTPMSQRQGQQPEKLYSPWPQQQSMTSQPPKQGPSWSQRTLPPKGYSQTQQRPISASPSSRGQGNPQSQRSLSPGWRGPPGPSQSQQRPISASPSWRGRGQGQGNPQSQRSISPGWRGPPGSSPSQQRPISSSPSWRGQGNPQSQKSISPGWGRPPGPGPSQSQQKPVSPSPSWRGQGQGYPQSSQTSLGSRPPGPYQNPGSRYPPSQGPSRGQVGPSSSQNSMRPPQSPSQMQQRPATSSTSWPQMRPQASSQRRFPPNTTGSSMGPRPYSPYQAGTKSYPASAPSSQTSLQGQPKPWQGQGPPPSYSRSAPPSPSPSGTNKFGGPGTDPQQLPPMEMGYDNDPMNSLPPTPSQEGGMDPQAGYPEGQQDPAGYPPEQDWTKGPPQPPNQYQNQSWQQPQQYPTQSPSVRSLPPTASGFLQGARSQCLQCVPPPGMPGMRPPPPWQMRGPMPPRPVYPPPNRYPPPMGLPSQAQMRPYGLNQPWGRPMMMPPYPSQPPGMRPPFPPAYNNMRGVPPPPPPPQNWPQGQVRHQTYPLPPQRAPPTVASHTQPFQGPLAKYPTQTPDPQVQLPSLPSSHPALSQSQPPSRPQSVPPPPPTLSQTYQIPPTSSTVHIQTAQGPRQAVMELQGTLRPVKRTESQVNAGVPATVDLQLAGNITILPPLPVTPPPPEGLQHPALPSPSQQRRALPSPNPSQTSTTPSQNRFIVDIPLTRNN